MKKWAGIGALVCTPSSVCAQAPVPSPLWRFRGLKEDYAGIARENLGIIRHIGKRLSTGAWALMLEHLTDTQRDLARSKSNDSKVH